MAEEKTTKQKKASSKKQTSKKQKLSEKEFEKKVLELADKGLTSEKIGLELKKQGIHPPEYKKKISKILKENEKYQSPDLKNIESKLERIKTHFENNKQDKRAKREKDRVFAQLRKVKKYLGVPVR
ncbi:MAG: hypothetical protein ACOC1P_04690 [Minisyncoccales bacterium]